MPKLRIPKVKVKPKDFSKLPWTEEFRTKYPTQIVENLVDAGMSIEDMRDFLFVEKHMDYRKANLLVSAYKEEVGVVRNDSEILLEICVPICDNQCSNCDRITYKRTNKCYKQYYDALHTEIQATRSLIRKKGFFVKAVCFTGNVLAFEPSEIEELFTLVAYPLCEICVEVSDAKNITREKLDILKKFANVRFVLNALTFNMVTLRTINKHFELREIRQNLELLKEYNFDLNIRLVVGMGKERDLQLMRNLKISMELGASCIDLYARFCPRITARPPLGTAQIATQRQMLETVSDYMTEQKFTPYFLYCSEVENGCFENVGYCLPNKKSKYIEDRMYAISSVVGCGVCAESMIVKNLSKTRKFYRNTTDLKTYNKTIDDVIQQKLEFFE